MPILVAHDVVEAERLEVGGGATYKVYAWYTTFSGSTPVTARRGPKPTPSAVPAGDSVTVNFTGADGW